MSDKAYVVATIRRWNTVEYHHRVSRCPGTWHLVDDPDVLTADYLAAIKPRYVFFPHWSERVSPEVFETYECVCFHETDVPFGRGGSPIQNLIARGYESTVITALRMVSDFDAGPVYAKRQLSLEGLAEEIFLRSATTVFDMIEDIVHNEPEPTPQSGEPTVFKRRKPEQSRINGDMDSLKTLFDHMRMLDAEGYPRAFLEHGNYRFEFTRPALRTGRVEANVTITQITEKDRNK